MKEPNKVLLGIKWKGSIPTYQFLGNFPSSMLVLFSRKFPASLFFTYTNEKNPPYPLLLEPTRLLNLKKNSSQPFY